MEQIWARPTCDVNGVVGGYTGKARKLCCPRRRAPNSPSDSSERKTPKKLVERFRAFVLQRLPPDVKPSSSPTALPAR